MRVQKMSVVLSLKFMLKITGVGVLEFQAYMSVGTQIPVAPIIVKIGRQAFHITE